MSLRARLIVAMAVVGIVLVLAAIAITTTTESHLLGQLDDRLQEVAVRQQGFGARPASGRRLPERRRTGQLVLRRLRRPHRRDRAARQGGVEERVPARPEASRSNDIANLAPGEHAYFSVSSDGGPRYRVLAARPSDGRRRDRRRARTRNDVDNAIRRLGDGRGPGDRRDRRGARARHLLGHPARRAPDQADDRDRVGHRRR